MIEEHVLVPFEVSPLPAGPWLVFSPHPDDETFGMGGSLLLAAEQGVPAHVVCITDGALGGGIDHQRLVSLREHEAREAAALLGLQSIDFWRQADRGLRVTGELAARVAAAVDLIRPASVFFPSPFELHPDHRATALLVSRGLARSEWFCEAAYGYEITVQFRVTHLIDITSVRERKRAVMEVYGSQLAAKDYLRYVEALDLVRTYTLPPGMRAAEGFYRFESFRDQPLESQLLNLYQPYLAADG